MEHARSVRGAAGDVGGVGNIGADRGGYIERASRPGGETGRRLGLKILWGQPRPGSNPGPGIVLNAAGIFRTAAIALPLALDKRGFPRVVGIASPAIPGSHGCATNWSATERQHSGGVDMNSPGWTRAVVPANLRTVSLFAKPLST